TCELPRALAALGRRGCARVLLTGSVFEGGEGAGSEDLPAFSPYGLSKEMTASAFRYFVARAGMRLGKFVIPNPFGPFEEPRFTAYLVRTWAGGETARVSTPDYVRDNIHVDLLAKAYADFAASLPEAAGFDAFYPSGYVETQGRFAERFAAEMRPRLGLECGLDLALQTEFPEPRMRVNTDPLNGAAMGWSEASAWDAIADYYKPQLSQYSAGRALTNG
ncbi:MAG: NAD-dependent epimerase/dehydratase family protein, partial [Pseudomonadales bacterium]